MMNRDSHLPLSQKSAAMILPEVAVSRDGQRAVLVKAFDTQWRGLSNRDAAARDVEVRVMSRRPATSIKLIVTGELPIFWNIPGQSQRWPESFEDSFPEIAVAGIGEYLDNAPQPEHPDGQNYAAVVWITTEFFGLFTREPEDDDARMLRYIGGKLYWGYRLGVDGIRFGRHDALRFGVDPEDLHRLAWQSNGVLWECDASRVYRPLPRLLTDFRAGVLPGQERPVIEQVGRLIDRQRYPAAALHIDKAIRFLHGSNVDLENAAKEAVLAVESVAKSVLDLPSATLGDCVKEFRTRDLMPREMARILESVYAYRNSTPGVGHGGTDIPSVTSADASFVLGVAAVAINYLDVLWPKLRAASWDGDARNGVPRGTT